MQNACRTAGSNTYSATIVVNTGRKCAPLAERQRGCGKVKKRGKQKNQGFRLRIGETSAGDREAGNEGCNQIVSHNKQVYWLKMRQSVEPDAIEWSKVAAPFCTCFTLKTLILEYLFGSTSLPKNK